jgi:multisubunit Na+/H+ antiporter MnhE subunit
VRRPALAVGLLAAVYCLVLGQAGPWDVVAGLAAGAAALAVASPAPRIARGRPLPLPALARRAVAFGPFAMAVGAEIVRGTSTVARIVLAPRPRPRPGLVEVPIGERSRTGVVVSALALTLAPGSVLVDIDWARGLMVLHVIDAGDPDAIRATCRALYERYQRPVFP